MAGSELIPPTELAPDKEETDGEITIAFISYKFFLYLPLLLACREVALRSVGLNRKFRTFVPLAKTDTSAVESLYGDTYAEPEAHFAACDPMTVLTAKQNDLVVLAAVVVNNAFFAVDHGKINVEQFADLGKYDEIVSFGQGTTSYALAKHVQKKSPGQKLRILETDPGREVELLTRPVEFNRVVLTPNVLEIAQIEDRPSDRRGRVEFDFSRSSAFSNQVVTALITRRSFLAANKELVRKFLSAVQSELRRVTESPLEADVREFATGHFFCRTPELAERAVQRANDSQLWPNSIEIGFSQWEATLRAGGGWAVSAEDGTEALARVTYDQFVRPGLDVVRSAAIDGNALYANSISAVVSQEPKKGIFDVLIPSVSLALGILLLIASYGFHREKVIVPLVGGLLVGLGSLNAWPRLSRLRLYTFFVVLSIAVALGALIALSVAESHNWGDFSLSIIKALLGASISALVGALRDYLKTRS